uniref:XK-related protein 8 n=1 Tax=Scatophagus argus TaxID=75038 RepID=UPI001ED804A0|nr:XK-related protein 8 [Scatophagus argus]
MGVFKYSLLDFLFTCVGLVFFLLDIGLDIWTVVTFYQEKAYASLGILLLFLLGSSVLVQAFSWLWYSYEDFNRETKAEKCLSQKQLKLLHVLQLGIYFRHAGVVEVSLRSFFTKQPCIHEDFAVYLSHDLSMLRLIETFSESAPQLVLMLTITLQRGHLEPVTVLKAVGSASAIAFSMTMYHRSLRSFLPEKEKQKLTSSVVFFAWNLFLIASRLTALALFASMLPCFIFTHFFCSWLLLFFFAWRSKTDFMDSACGEWLYRATVGLIWYFDWFNVVEGRTRYRTAIYHGYMLADISLLCGLWCWKMTSAEHTYFQVSPLYAVITAVSVVAVYILGICFKLIYYKYYHPNLVKEQLKGQASDEAAQGPQFETFHTDEIDFASNPQWDQGDADDFPQTLMRACIGDIGIADRIGSCLPAPEVKRCNKRMRKLAENFYS